MSLIVEVASVPDRDNVVAEIWQDDEMVAEMQSTPEGRFVLEVYANQKPWSLDLDEWLSALDEARQRLI